jgi:hypothetical protein
MVTSRAKASLKRMQQTTDELPVTVNNQHSEVDGQSKAWFLKQFANCRVDMLLSMQKQYRLETKLY